MVIPVVAACGHTFEKEAIEEWINDGVSPTHQYARMGTRGVSYESHQPAKQTSWDTLLITAPECALISQYH